MKYISLDIETTGLSPTENDILEIGMYIEDTTNQLPREQLPAFHAYIWKENYRGNAFALEMNAHIFKKILALRKLETKEYLEANNPQYLYNPEDVWDAFDFWTYKNKDLFPEAVAKRKFVVAGKNIASFDLPFLSELPGKMPKFHHRIIDPGMMYFNPLTDEVPPDLKTCKQRAGLEEEVTHQALDDSWDVIRLIRHKYPQV